MKNGTSSTAIARGFERATTKPLALAVVASALLAIAGASFDQSLLVFVFKPMTTLLVIAHAWTRGAQTPRPRAWVLAGLALSLVGDVALLWPREGFLPGLIAFLLAHLAYLGAFMRVQRLAARPIAFVVYGLVAGAILAALWPHVPSGLRLPVLAYVVCLASMAAQAAVLWLAVRGSDDASMRARARTLALGGALFVVSDALLATNRFAHALPASSLLILATYWAAQWCIASWLRESR